MKHQNRIICSPSPKHHPMRWRWNEKYAETWVVVKFNRNNSLWVWGLGQIWTILGRCGKTEWQGITRSPERLVWSYIDCHRLCYTNLGHQVDTGIEGKWFSVCGCQCEGTFMLCSIGDQRHLDLNNAWQSIVYNKHEIFAIYTGIFVAVTRSLLPNFEYLLLANRRMHWILARPKGHLCLIQRKWLTYTATPPCVVCGIVPPRQECIPVWYPP